MTGYLVDFQFAPTISSLNNLLNEAKKESIFVTGNTAMDCLKYTVTAEYYHPVLNLIGEQKMILLTTHRRDNSGESMGNTIKAILKNSGYL